MQIIQFFAIHCSIVIVMNIQILLMKNLSRWMTLYKKENGWNTQDNNT